MSQIAVVVEMEITADAAASKLLEMDAAKQPAMSNGKNEKPVTGEISEVLKFLFLIAWWVYKLETNLFLGFIFW